MWHASTKLKLCWLTYLSLPLLSASLLYFTPLGLQFQLQLSWPMLALQLLISPLVEESVFRGLVQEWLSLRGIKPCYIIISVNLFFSLAHVAHNSHWWYLGSVFGAGCIFSLVKYQHHSLRYPILLHSYYNLCFITAWELRHLIHTV